MKPRFSKTILNHKFILATCIIVTISATTLFPISVFGLPVTDKMTTVTGKVTIALPIPSLCKANISHFDNFFLGTKNNQRLVGTNQNDLIIGFKNTLIYGKAGDDCLVGGNGNNLIEGGPGNDVIIGGSGLNIIFTGNGNNIVKGGPSNDIIFFGHGHNIIDGGTGKNYCIGNRSNSIIINCLVISHSHGEHGSHDNDKIIDILSDIEFSEGKRHGLPSWMKTDLDWWNAGKTSDDELSSEIHYLYDTS
jgi:hypothetical protein